MPALLIAAWAAILLIAFFANRGSDVGQLAKLFGDLGGGPLIGTDGFRDSLVGSIGAVAILLSWFGLGSFLLSLIPVELKPERSHVLEIVIAVALGADSWSFVWFVFGLLGLYNPAVAIASTVIGLALAVYGLRRLGAMRGESRTPEKPSGADYLLLALIAVPVVLAFVGAVASPTAKDTLLYHFALPKAYIAQGSNAFVEGNIASYLARRRDAQRLGDAAGPRVGR